MFWVSKRLEPPRISGSIIKICYPSVNMSSVRCDFPHDYIIDDFPVFSWGFSMLSMGFPRVSPGKISNFSWLISYVEDTRVDP